MEDSLAANRRYTLLQRPKQDRDVEAPDSAGPSLAAQAASLEEREKLYEATKRRLMCEQLLPPQYTNAMDGAATMSSSASTIARTYITSPTMLTPPPLLAPGPPPPPWVAYPYIPVWYEPLPPPMGWYHPGPPPRNSGEGNM